MQSALNIRGSITVTTVGLRFDWVGFPSFRTKQKIALVKSNPVKLETSIRVILSPTAKWPNTEAIRSHWVDSKARTICTGDWWTPSLSRHQIRMTFGKNFSFWISTSSTCDECWNVSRRFTIWRRDVKSKNVVTGGQRVTLANYLSILWLSNHIK